MQTDLILDRLPFILAARLATDSFFCDIPIIVAVEGDIQAQLKKKQAVITEKSGRHGVAVVINQIEADDEYPGLPGGPLKLYPSFQAIEDVMANNREGSGTRKSARRVCRRIISNLKIFGQFGGVVQAMKVRAPGIEAITFKDQPDTVVVEQVNFECQEFSGEKLLYCLPPVLAPVVGSNPPQVTITSATVGAQVWYTTDGSYPYPGGADKFPGSTAVQAVAPINVSLNQPWSALACAYLEGYFPSMVPLLSIVVTQTPTP